MCRFYGQKVRKMGIALYLLHPVFFTDTTNIWKESNKYKRISVSLAGPVSDFGFIALVYFLNHYVVKDPVLYNYIIIMLYFTVIRSLFNFNPFIKLDGYYILMDMLEIPNLRKKSLNYIKNIIFRKNTGTSISNTQKFIFLTFGILSSVMTVLFIASFLFYIYRMIYR
jgi:putative peptide zinc metalloprotease protein